MLAGIAHIPLRFSRIAVGNLHREDEPDGSFIYGRYSGAQRSQH